jgi:glucosyl-3-phosphoglycerate synthase
VTPDEVPWTLQRDDFDLTAVRAQAAATSVAVIIPARDEASTIGGVLDAVQAYPDLVNELVVVNDHSVDDTAVVAAHHGARVVDHVGSAGKGGAMDSGRRATTADILVFLDADVVNTSREFVPRLLQPLLARADISLVKGYYQRPLHDMPTGGGRVNELTARPILSLLYPGLGEIRQPLAGETAVRRRALEGVNLEAAYGVEIALLIDIARRDGVHALAQVDLGIRRHRNRPLEELRPMATDILRVALERGGVSLPER